nr:hypothetical protein [Ruminococcus sp. AF43-11]
MTYPSSADELIFDRTTMPVRNGAEKMISALFQ